MHLSIGSMVSVVAAAVRTVRWWRARQRRIARTRRFRQVLAAGGLLVAMAGAIAGILILSHPN